MCTALSKTDTTVKFGHDEDTCLVNGEAIDRGIRTRDDRPRPPRCPFARSIAGGFSHLRTATTRLRGKASRVLLL